MNATSDPRTMVTEATRNGAVSPAHGKENHLSGLRRLANLELWPAQETEAVGKNLRFVPLGPREILGWSFAVLGAFHLAYLVPLLCGLMGVFAFSLLQVARVRSGRTAMYLGLVLGLGLYGPHLAFFWAIFGPAALGLWLVLAFWLGLFLMLTRRAYTDMGYRTGCWMAPALWLGLEYFRSELYYLRFAWVTPGFAFVQEERASMLAPLGVYGIGFGLMILAAVVATAPPRLRPWLGGMILFTVCLVGSRQWPPPSSSIATQVQVTGIQLEFPAESEVESTLDEAIRATPATDLFVLSEYTFDGPVPAKIKEWCHQNGKYLVVGGKHEEDSANWFNTVFVIGPNGEVVFQQAKSVPIQFFKDGLPAREQRLWYSPWGKIAIAVCYDLSYARVIDRLVERGAQALLVPTMDVSEWGAYQHRLHARVAPVRAAEYGLPIFRIASSGISQLVTAQGQVVAKAGFPGAGERISGTLHLVTHSRTPLDRWLAPVAVSISGAWVMLALLRRWRMRGKSAALTVKR